MRRQMAEWISAAIRGIISGIGRGTCDEDRSECAVEATVKVRDSIPYPEKKMLKIAPLEKDCSFKVEFSFEAAPGRRIAVAGSFNDWDPETHPLVFDSGRGCYLLSLTLASGYYEYKFVVDGKWLLDEGNPNFSANDFGTLNSVLRLE